MRFGLDLGQGRFGHLRVMFEGHRLDRLVAGDVADQPNEAANPTDAVVAVRQLFQFLADVKILGLYPDHGFILCF